MIYKWGYTGGYADLSSVGDIMNEFQFNPVPAFPAPLVNKETYKPIEFELFEGEGEDKRKTRGIADFISNTSAHILSERAVDALSDLWEKYGELYPITVKGYDNPYYVFFPTNVVDCLDYEKSTLKGEGYKWDLYHRRFSVLLKFVFHEDKVGDNTMFTLPDEPYGTIYVNETFKERVKKAKLKGIALYKEFFDPKPWKP